MGCQKEKHVFTRISWCGRGGDATIGEYVPLVKSNNIPWWNMKYVRESRLVPLECRYVAWESFEGRNSLILSVMEKSDQSFFVGNFIKHCWSDDMRAINASILGKKRKSDFWGLKPPKIPTKIISSEVQTGFFLIRRPYPTFSSNKILEWIFFTFTPHI